MDLAPQPRPALSSLAELRSVRAQWHVPAAAFVWALNPPPETSVICTSLDAPRGGCELSPVSKAKPSSCV